MKTLWKLIAKIGLTISLSWGLYFWWSKIFRFLWQRKYRGHVKPRHTVVELREVLRNRKWKKDTWRELGDAISYPLYFENVGSLGELGNDCDDHSIWCLDAAREGITNGELKWFPEGLMSVVWKDGWKLSGHNVAIFRAYDGNTVKIAHMSNWANGRLYIMEGSIYESAALDVANAMGKPLVAWRLTTPDLRKKIACKIYI